MSQTPWVMGSKGKAASKNQRQYPICRLCKIREGDLQKKTEINEGGVKNGPAFFGNPIYCIGRFHHKAFVFCYTWKGFEG
jgi:hypothetical protein